MTGPAGDRRPTSPRSSTAPNVRLLAATASVVAVLLVITYRSPVLWLVPLIVVGVADRLAAVLATHTLAAFDVAWDESTIGILSVLVFGAGTDYALLLISPLPRRAARHRGPPRGDAPSPLRRTAEAVLSSATTVVLGLLTLLLSLFPTTRGLGLACAVGVVVAATFVLVVLPAAAGRSSVAGSSGRKVPARRRARRWPTRRSLWRRIGDAVATRPAGSSPSTVVRASASWPLGVAQHRDRAATRPTSSSRSPRRSRPRERLAESFPAGTADPTDVVTRGRRRRRSRQRSRASTAWLGAGRRRRAATASAEVDVVLDAEPGTDEAADAVVALRDALVGVDRRPTSAAPRPRRSTPPTPPRATGW